MAHASPALVGHAALLLALALALSGTTAAAPYQGPASTQQHKRHRTMRYTPLFGGEYQTQVGKNASSWAQELARQHAAERNSVAVLRTLQPVAHCPPGHSLANMGTLEDQIYACRPDKDPAKCAAFVAGEGSVGTAAASTLLSGTPCFVHSFACGGDGAGTPLDPARHYPHDLCLSQHVSGLSLPYTMARTWLGYDSIDLLVAETRGHVAVRMFDTWRLDDPDLPSQVVLLLRQGWQLGAPDIGSRAAAEELRLVLQLARSGYALVHRWNGVGDDGGGDDGSSSGTAGSDNAGGTVSGASEGSGSSSSSSSKGAAENGGNASSTDATNGGTSADTSSTSANSNSSGTTTTSNTNSSSSSSSGESSPVTRLRRGLSAHQWRRGSASNAHPPEDPNLGLPQQLTFVRVSVPHKRQPRGNTAGAAAAAPWHAPVSGETSARLAEMGGITMVPALKLEALQQAAAALREAAAAGAIGSHQEVWREVWRLSKWMGDLTDRGASGFRCDHVHDLTLPLAPRRAGARYFFALNLRNNAAVAPHLFSELLQSLMMLPREDVFVSVYESDSKDTTPAWLSLFSDALSTLGIHHTVIAGGPEKLEEKGDRIGFLAAVRNAAMRPLLPAAARQPVGSFSPGAQLVVDTWRHQPGGWPADHVVFVNDVYVCAHDVMRLMQHDADIACGMDFDRCCGGKRRRAARRLQRRRLQQAGVSGSSGGGSGGEGSSGSSIGGGKREGVGGADASIDTLWQGVAPYTQAGSAGWDITSSSGSSSATNGEALPHGSGSKPDELNDEALASEQLHFQQLASSYEAAAAQEAEEYSAGDGDDDNDNSYGSLDYDEDGSDESIKDAYQPAFVFVQQRQRQQQQQQHKWQQRQQLKRQEQQWQRQQEENEQEQQWQEQQAHLPARTLLRDFPASGAAAAAAGANAGGAAAAGAPCPLGQVDLSHVEPEFRSYEVSKATEWDARQHRKYYDTWVGRDRAGRRILKSPPFVSDEASIARLALGLPVAVRSCWNGLVVMRAAPFVEHGLRFRTARYSQGECGSSECTLLADDFWRLGYRHFIMDPSIRLTYDIRHAAAVWTKDQIQMLPLKPTPWPEVERAMAVGEGRRVWAVPLEARQRECCDLKPGERAVPFDKCAMRDFLASNYTEMALQEWATAA